KTHIVVRSDVEGVQSYRLLEAIECFFVTSLIAEHLSFIVPGKRVKPVKLKAPVKTLHCFVMEAQSAQAHPFVVPLPRVELLWCRRSDDFVGLMLKQNFQVVEKILKALVPFGRFLLEAAPDYGEEWRVHFWNRRLFMQSVHGPPEAHFFVI